MKSSQAPLAQRFRDHVLASGHIADGDGVVVALSGGLDSVALLHLLRFTEGLPALHLTAAHLDHGMRAGSAADAAWVVGLTRAWGIPVVRETASETPASEDAARNLRYAFLEEVRARSGARWVVTAHHADDVVETVLFRVARGTGVRGLRGIPELRAPGVWRPLLPFHRAELEAYAAECGLRWRDDPTNASEDYARNVIRHTVLPALERGVSPQARTAVVRLARLARQDEDAWESLLPDLIEGLTPEHGAETLSVSREALVAHHPAVRARVLRVLARRLGRELDAAGTRVAQEFTNAGRSGGEVRLTGGLVLRRSLDRLELDAAAADVAGDRTVTFEGSEGQARAVLGGSTYEVVWGPGPQRATWTERFDAGAAEMPLSVRGWAPGDRIRLSYGTKKLKKLFLEARLPREARDRTPVLVDAREVVLWIPGLARADAARAEDPEYVLNVGITRV